MEIYDQPTGPTDAITLEHDVDYAVCKNDRKCKNDADRKMVQALNTKARYIRKSSLGRSRLICQSPLKCAGQIQNGGRFEFKKGKL